MRVGLSAFLALGILLLSSATGQEKKAAIPHGQSKAPGAPLSPEEAVKAMSVPPGFTVECVASEPDIVNPVAMHIDEKGRFWITESLEYPKNAAGPGRDRVKVLEIGDDGKAKKVTTVIEGLNIPSGIAVGHGGVWVANAPDILYYPIKDFDNLKLGKPQVVVTGFGRADTHELPNSLTWGPDGYLYGLNGVYNPSHIKQDGKEWKFTCAMFRIHPRTKKFDLFCEGTSNPWGIAFNDHGDAFVSACVIDHLWHLVQTGYYHRQGGPYPPFTWKIGSIVQHKHQKAAYCGIVWFDSDAYPEEYRKKLYMGNIHGGAINVDEVVKDGSTYFGRPALAPVDNTKKASDASLPSPPVLRGRGAGGEGDSVPRNNPKATASDKDPLTPALSPGVPGERGKEADAAGEKEAGTSPRPKGRGIGVGEGSNFLVANDAWFMPVAQKVGPDGCLYILDWYDRYHCYQDARRDPQGIDRLKGRLYRVRYKETPRAEAVNLRWKEDDELIKLLDNSNVYLREHAHRLLFERHSQVWEQSLKTGELPRHDATKIPSKLARDVIQSEFTSRAAKVRAMGLMAALGINLLAPTAFPGLLHHDDSLIRSWAIRMEPNHRKTEFAGKLAQMPSDPSADVLVQLAIAAPKLNGVDPLPVLIDVLNNAGNDKLIPHIVWQNLHPLLEDRADDFLEQVAKLDPEKSANVYNLMPRVVERILGSKKQDPQAIVSLVALLANSPSSRESCAKVLAMLNAKVQTGELAGEQLKTLEDRLLPAIRKLNNGPNRELAIEALMLGAAFRDAESVKSAHLILMTPGQPNELRIKSLEALIAARDRDLVDAVDGLFSEPRLASPAMRANMLTSLGKLDHPVVAEIVLKNYASFDGETQPRAVELLTQRAAWSAALLDEIARKKIPAAAVNVNQVRKLLASRDEAIKKHVESIWGTIREDRNPAREEVVASMRELIQKTPGDPHRGVVVFKKLCAQCHKMHGEGAEVGPDLTGNGRSDFEQLLSNVFDPSLVIGVGYRTTNVVTSRGQVINGLLVEDSPQRIILKTQGGKIETIARGDVEEMTTLKLSYMPEGVETQLMPNEIADLFAYLVLDRPPGDPTARKIRGAP